MKSTILILIMLLLVTSCNNTDPLSGLEARMTTLENQNKILLDSLNTVNTYFINPFKMYEQIVLSELENSPDQIISDYELLIHDYPNSFWKHEAKKRIEKIERRKKYWSEKEGWKLPEKPAKIELIDLIEPMVITCPGC